VVSQAVVSVVTLVLLVVYRGTPAIRVVVSVDTQVLAGHLVIADIQVVV